MDEPRKLLTRAGWHPGREVDIRKDLLALSRDGYTVHSTATRFLGQYSGLRLTVRADGNRLEFGGKTAISGIPFEQVEWVGQIVGQNLVPIAEFGPIVVMIDERGYFWGIVDFQFGILGESVEELIQEILDGPRGKRRLDMSLTDQPDWDEP